MTLKGSVSSLFSYSGIFRIDHHGAFAATVVDENTDSGIVSPFQKGGKGDLSFYCFVIMRSAATWQSH